MMIEQDVLDSVDELFKSRDIEASPTLSMKLSDYLDSMSILELILILEEKGYSVNQVDIPNLDTAESLVEALG